MDIRLHFVEAGEGRPLILLHGNGEDGTYFARQIEHFKATRRVIAVDTRGHGGSPRGAAPFTLGQFADDLGDFMDGQGIPSADILGFSDGANIALLFALGNPGRVDRLVLNGGNLFPEGLTRQALFVIKSERRQALERGDAHHVALMDLMLEEPHIDPADLASLDMPVLVVAGSADMVEEAHTRLMAESIPGARLSIIEGSHYVAAENPEAFNAEVERFLDGS